MSAPKIIKGCWRDRNDEVMAAQYEPFIFIEHNGSKWMGQNPDDIETLLDTLDKYALRPDFEDYGNFIGENPCIGVRNPEYNPASTKKEHQEQWIDGPRIFNVDGVFHFDGNFLELSHGFSIFTNNPETIKSLTLAIRANQDREDYKKAKKAA